MRGMRTFTVFLLGQAVSLQTPEGVFPYDGRAGVGPQAESLLRLAVLAAHRPDARLEGAMIRGAPPCFRQ